MLLRKFSDSESRPTLSKMVRRTALLQDAFSLRLPKVSPRLVLPPTPLSPDNAQLGPELLDWRPHDKPDEIRHLKEDRDATVIEEQEEVLQHSSPVKLTPPQKQQTPYTPADTPPPDLPPSLKAVPSEPTSLAHLLSSGKALHPFLLDNYHVVEELGAGGYGVVVRALRVPDMQDVAVKILWRSKMPKEGWIGVTGWEPKLLTTPVVVPKEAHILRQINHPGVVAYVDYFEDDNFLYLVMEHFGSPWSIEMARDTTAFSGLVDSVSGHGAAHANSLHLDLSPKTPPRPAGPIRRASCDLFECLEAYQRLPEETSKYVFRQLAETVCYLHRSGIVHCDLKDENIVIDADFRVKIIDFGSAQMLDPLKPAPYHQKFRGTITFAAPEILRGEVFQAPQAEVWALGCILSILLTGKGPFASADAARKAQISEPAAPIPLLAFDLMMGCLRLKPQDRLNICQVKDHPWLSD